jgi:hypothetical protein
MQSALAGQEQDLAQPALYLGADFLKEIMG